jgi:hypothetical protein
LSSGRRERPRERGKTCTGWEEMDVQRKEGREKKEAALRCCVVKRGHSFCFRETDIVPVRSVSSKCESCLVLLCVFVVSLLSCLVLSTRQPQDKTTTRQDNHKTRRGRGGAGGRFLSWLVLPYHVLSCFILSWRVLFASCCDVLCCVVLM